MGRKDEATDWDGATGLPSHRRASFEFDSDFATQLSSKQYLKRKARTYAQTLPLSYSWSQASLKNLVQSASIATTAGLLEEAMSFRY